MNPFHLSSTKYHGMARCGFDFRHGNANMDYGKIFEFVVVS
jgi:hypothetical protein